MGLAARLGPHGSEDRAGEVFVGRTGDLRLLVRALEAAREGTGATVLVAGEAGIGKTRLVSELVHRARDSGVEVLLGRSIDLVGTELPYQPFVEALRPLGGLGRAAGSQLDVFERTLALVGDRSAGEPVLLVLEDLHWADTSSLDLLVYLAHNLSDHRVLLVGTYRADEPTSAGRMRRLADGVARSGSGLALDLGPLADEDMTALLEARAADPSPSARTTAIVVRAEGNPYLAEELLAADDGAELPRGPRDLLLRRVTRLDRATQAVVRLASVAGRDVSYALLRAVAGSPEAALRESLRQAVEHGVLFVDQASGRFRFRHALLAEAVYATNLPGEREELHERLAEELARTGAAGAAELAPHWAAAGRPTEALEASVQAAREAESVFGLAEALGHLERALVLWPRVAHPAELVLLDLPELCAWAAWLAGQTGAAARAVELAQRAIDLVPDGDAVRAAWLLVDLAGYLHMTGRRDAALDTLQRAVELVPARPPSRVRAHMLAALAYGLMLSFRHEESRRLCGEALPLARAVGARGAELRALTALGADLAYLGRGDEGIALLAEALQVADSGGNPVAAERVYVCLTDALLMLGRPRESARVAYAGLEALRPYGRDHTTLVANRVEALVAAGAWDDADRESRAALRAITATQPHQPLITRAELEAGRGEFDAARAHLRIATATVHGDPSVVAYEGFVADLALWERRWGDADAAVRSGLARARAAELAQLRLPLYAKGLRALAELAALAHARHDADAAGECNRHADALLSEARATAAAVAAVTPTAAGWLTLAEAEHERGRHHVRPQLWAEAAVSWEALERAPLAAYCRWRQAEALVAAGEASAVATEPLREAYTVAARIGARPLLRELDLLATRARLDPTPAEDGRRQTSETLHQLLGITAREAEVLTLMARGRTNREIAAVLVISVKTAGVHVSHILRKLDVSTRVEAAAIAHRLAPPEGGSGAPRHAPGAAEAGGSRTPGTAYL